MESINQQTKKRFRNGSGDMDEDDQTKNILQAVDDFQKIESPEVKDLSSLMINFIKYSISGNKRIDKLEEDVDSLEREVEAQKLESAEINRKLDTLSKKVDQEKVSNDSAIQGQLEKTDSLQSSLNKSQSSVNMLLQHKIDNDLIIRGFPGKPDHKVVRDNFINIFNLDPVAISSSYYFPYTSKFSGKTSHNVIISFRDIETKMNVLSLKKQSGPLLLSQLTLEFPGTSEASTVTYTNRLTKFNLYAINQLNKTKSAGLIFKVRYHNLCFGVMEKKNSNWIRITNHAELEKYLINDP